MKTVFVVSKVLRNTTNLITVAATYGVAYAVLKQHHKDVKKSNVMSSFGTTYFRCESGLYRIEECTFYE